MKLRSLALLVFCFLYSCQNSRAATVTGSWQYNFGTGGAVVCSATVTTSCIQTFALEDVSNASNPVTIGTVQAPALTLTTTATLSYGPHQFAVVASGLDGSGKPISSPQSTAVSVTVNPSAPTGLAVAVE